MRMTFDTSRLASASSKNNLAWRQTALTLIAVTSDGEVHTAYKLADKQALLADLGASDLLLAVRAIGFPDRQQVLWVDDLNAARSALDA
jgi:hypothetical protein